MIGCETAPDWRLLVTVALGLLLFGVIYNEWVGRLDDQKDGYTALLVVVGVLVTLAGVAIVDWRAAALVAGAFIFSGAPMILGDIWRANKRRQAELERLRKEAQRDIDRATDGGNGEA